MTADTPGFHAWLDQARQNPWARAFNEDDLRPLYERYPGASLEDIILKHVRADPETFEALGVTVDNQRPTEIFKGQRLQ